MIQNKKAFFDYDIQDTLLAGMVLQGWEVKSIRNQNAHIKGAWIKIRNGEAFLENFQINPYKFAPESKQTTTQVKLLLKKKEIDSLERKIKEKNMSLVPLRILDRSKHIKCEIGIGKGRKKYEKRNVLKERTEKREIAQKLKKFRT